MAAVEKFAGSDRSRRCIDAKLSTAAYQPRRSIHVRVERPASDCKQRTGQHSDRYKLHARPSASFRVFRIANASFLPFTNHDSSLETRATGGGTLNRPCTRASHIKQSAACPEGRNVPSQPKFRISTHRSPRVTHTCYSRLATHRRIQVSFL
jgi:hypothetical protein